LRTLLLKLGDVGGDDAFNLIESVLALPVPPDGDYRPIKGGAWYRGAGAVLGAGQIGGPRALSRIEKSLGIPQIKAAAAWSLGFVGDPKASSVLEKVVVGDNAFARRNAAFAAGLIATESALPALENLVADPDIDVRVTTAWALAQIGGPKALALLAKITAKGSTRNKADVAAFVRCSMALIGSEREWQAVRADNIGQFAKMMRDHESEAGSFGLWTGHGLRWE
jgi:hypothetical protein